MREVVALSHHVLHGPTRFMSDSYATEKQLLWTEIEFEWIRQWYIQGARHARLHPYWHDPLKFLENCWSKLKDDTTVILNELKSGSADENMYDVMIESHLERFQLREKWELRLCDPIYAGMESDSKPITCDKICTITLEDIKATIRDLRIWKKRKYAGSKTQKEKRKVASNWESMKALVKKQKRR